MNLRILLITLLIFSYTLLAQTSKVETTVSHPQISKSVSNTGLNSIPKEVSKENKAVWEGFWYHYPADCVLKSTLLIEVKNDIIVSAISKDETINQEVLGTKYTIGDLDKTEISVALWREIRFALKRRDGTLTTVELLRPLWWIYGEQVRKGKEYFFDMPEVRMKGYFQVLEITPLKNTSFKDATDTQTVIGKFGHQDAFIWNLYFEGNPEPLGVTNVHPFYSVERQKWVQAGELYIGELVQGKDSNLKLVGKKRLEGKHQVFNLEVHQIHNYFVSKQNILTHNNDDKCPIVKRQIREIESRFDNIIDDINQRALDARQERADRYRSRMDGEASGTTPQEMIANQRREGRRLRVQGVMQDVVSNYPAHVIEKAVRKLKREGKLKTYVFFDGNDFMHRGDTYD